MLHRLEQSGFVTRKRSTEDRRAVVVCSTHAGLALRDRMMQAWRDLEAVTAAGFTNEEYEQAMAVLARIEAISRLARLTSISRLTIRHSDASRVVDQMLDAAAVKLNERGLVLLQDRVLGGHR